MSDTQLSDEHHSWMESFFGVNTRDAASSGSASSSSGGGILDTLSNAASAVGDVARSAVNTAVDVTEKVSDTVLNVAGSAIEGVTDVTAKVGNAVVDAVPLPDVVKGAAHDVINFQKGVVEGAVDGAKGLVQGVTHLAGSVIKEGAALATSQKARDEAADTVIHGAKAVGGFVETAVTDPSKAMDEVGDAAKGAADTVVKIGKSVYHSYEEAQKAGQGAEWVGKAVGEVGIQVAGVVLTDGASLAGEGAAVAGEGMMLVEGAEALADGAALARGASVVEEGATLARGAEAVEEGATLARGTEAVEEGATVTRGTEAAEEAGTAAQGTEEAGAREGQLAEEPVDPAAPKEKVERSPTDTRETRPKGNIAPHNEQGLALRDAEGVRTSESEHILSRANIVEQTRNPETGLSAFDKEAYQNATTLKLDRATALDKTAGDNAAWRALRDSAGAPTEAQLEESGLEAAMRRTLDAAKRTGDASVTEEAVNLAGHGELGSLFEAGTEDARAFMQGVSDEEIEAVIEKMDEATVDGRFAGPKGMGIPMEEAPPRVRIATEEPPRVRIATEEPPMPVEDPAALEAQAEAEAEAKAQAEAEAAQPPKRRMRIE